MLNAHTTQLLWEFTHQPKAAHISLIFNKKITNKMPYSEGKNNSIGAVCNGGNYLPKAAPHQLII